MVFQCYAIFCAAILIVMVTALSCKCSDENLECLAKTMVKTIMLFMGPILAVLSMAGWMKVGSLCYVCQPF